MEIIGRKEEQRRLDDLYNSGSSEFLVVYGRRRVGKTYLIRQYYEKKFTFIATGMYKQKQEVQLMQFALALNEYFDIEAPTFKNWLEAFALLKKCLKDSGADRKLVFIDEVAWFDTEGSDFLAALEWFWNGWAASDNSMYLITCGSATSWITDNLLAAQGGLFNRATSQMYLIPFTLHETEEYLKMRGFNWSRYDIAECYMVMGGIPYYLKQLALNESYTANIDSLFFKKNGRLKDEFEHLYRTLFKNSRLYIKIVEALSEKTMGLTRDEISDVAKVAKNGMLSKALQDLVSSNFIRGYNYYGKAKNGVVYELCDYFTMFYFHYIKEHYGRDEHFWTLTIDDPSRRTWAGLMYEQVAKDHIQQVKQAIGIYAVKTEQSMWYSKVVEAARKQESTMNGETPIAEDGVSVAKERKGKKKSSEVPKRGAQIDLLIDRRDRVINICEAKFSLLKYTISEEYEEKLRKKMSVFRELTETNSALHLTMITTYGVKPNIHSGIVQSQVTMDDLFKE